MTAMVGRMSTPSAMRSPNASAATWPKGSSETMRFGSLHEGNGPMVFVGAVLLRSGRLIGLSAPEVTARARYSE